MDLGTMTTIFSFLFGLTLGSFLNVCIYRIPRYKSIINPPSSCPECGEKIKFYDNIPVISYIFLLGKCRNCRKSISLRYPVIELISSLLSTALFIKYGLGPQYFLFFAFAASLVIISFLDLHNQIIPDIISLPGILVGLGISFFLNHIYWLDSLIGIVGGGGFLFLVASIYERLTGKEGMGGGDVKLLAMIGAWLGWQSLPLVILISSLTGILIGGGALLLTGKGYQEKIPFGPFLAISALISLLSGNELAHWYYNLWRS